MMLTNTETCSVLRHTGKGIRRISTQATARGLSVGPRAVAKLEIDPWSLGGAGLGEDRWRCSSEDQALGLTGLVFPVEGRTTLLDS